MDVVEFPPAIPAPRSEGYSITSRTGVIRTDMEGGWARHRPVQKFVPDTVTVSWDLRRVQFGVLKQFVKELLGNGSGIFSMSYYTGASDGLVTGEFRFLNPSQPYKVTGTLGHEFVVTAELEKVKDNDINYFEYMAASYGNSLTDLSDSFDRLNRWINTDLVSADGDWLPHSTPGSG